MVSWIRSLLLSSLATANVLGTHVNYLDKRDACPGYKASNVQATDAGLTANLTPAGSTCNVYSEDLINLTLEVTYQSANRLHIKIQDRDNQVYQVPESVFTRPNGTIHPRNSKLKFEYTEEPFSFKVKRSDSDEILFDTSTSSLIFESQYLRLRTKLPNDPYLYGLGEHNDPFRLNTINYTRTLWAQDSYSIPEKSNLYGNHPFYLEHRKSGSHGVFLLNSNGMDIFIDKSGEQQYLEYNTLGGVFDFYFLSGPSPVEVVKQYAEVVGLPAMQPYWGLGFHQCRYGYQDVFDVAEVVYNYSQAGIPLETMWTDIDYMDRRQVFSLDPDRFPLSKMRELVSHLHENQQHYVMMVDPAVAYQNYGPAQRGLADNTLLLQSNGSIYLGVVWPGVTAYPDWFSENITQYWNGEFARFFDADAGVDIDALWIDMNEPTNFCHFPCKDPFGFASDGDFPPPPPDVREPPRPLPGWPADFQPGSGENPGTKREVVFIDEVPQYIEQAKFDRPGTSADRKRLPGRNLLHPQYAIHNKAAGQDSWNSNNGGLSNRTVQTDIIHQNGLAMYDTHNLYGHMMSIASYEAMMARRPGIRPLIITRSTFAGAGSKVGHWLGDNRSTWDKYRASIRTLLAFTSIFQFPMAGSDVCGFGGNTTEQLCARWASLGAFSPFYRNHNELGTIPQEFYQWDSVAESARKAIEIRYRLLDYLYTEMYKASRDGTPVLYPMFYLYPQDRKTWDLELQYFYGPGLLVAPVTEENGTSVDVYLPKDTFYDWYTHEKIEGSEKAHTFTEQGITTIPLLIRSGIILPLRISSANTTTEIRKRDFELIIPLGEDGKADGELYIDDGVSMEQESFTHVTFQYRHGELKVDGTFGKEVSVEISRIIILGGKKESKDCKISLNRASSVKF